jgi:hypothetical protein
MKFMGPNMSIILAAVSKVKETHQNMSVLMQLTNLNEVEYSFSLDLKLMNITIGIQTHSSRHSCDYGECYKDNDGNWLKGRDRTLANIRQNQTKWMQRSRDKNGTWANLKDHMNCEHDPLLGGNSNDPIIKTIPPPPLHTVLLGPVSHIIKEL